jgi:NAD(P)-dependent dehydrogenase (short-subunit alcohol dehydrogenase family)
MRKKMNQRLALVTGGAQGIGKAIAIAFLKEGYIVVIVDQDKRAGKQSQHELQNFGEILFLHGDVGKENEVKKIIQFIVKKYARIDMLVNNAGIMKRKALEKLTLKEWQKVLDTNLTSTFLFSRYCAKFLRKAKGAIVNITSTRALMSEANTEAYSATKGGIVGITHAMAISLGPDIRVNCISPGWIETQKTKLSKEDHEQHPAGRVGMPEDIAYMVAYLCSDKAGFITGANFVVDGGMTRKMIYK